MKTSETDQATAEVALEAMRSARWLVRNRTDSFIGQKISQLKEKCPAEVQAELDGVTNHLISIHPGTYGLCSLGTEGVILVRVFSEHADQLQGVAETIVRQLRSAFLRQGVSVEFDSDVEIRNTQNEHVVRAGTIVPHRSGSFRRYLAVDKPRDRLLLYVLLGLSIMAIAAGAAFALRGFGHETFPYWIASSVDRVATALLTGTLTTFLILYFGFREWLQEGDTIAWHG